MAERTIRCCAMQAEIKQNVEHWEDDDEVAAYLAQDREQAGLSTGTGSIYGMGHAVYTLKSDPRAVICKTFRRDSWPPARNSEAELNLLKSHRASDARGHRRSEKGTPEGACARTWTCTPASSIPCWAFPKTCSRRLFACARMAGWAAHRFEEIAAGKRIIRPAYKSTIAAAPAPLRADRAAGRDRSQARLRLPGDRTPGFAPVASGARGSARQHC